MLHVPRFELINRFHNSRPSIVHSANMRDHEVGELFRDIERSFYAQRSPRSSRTDLAIATVTNLKTTGSLEESLRHIGFDMAHFFRLGGGIADWQLHLKIDHMLQLCKKIDHPYTLFCDSHDVLVLNVLNIENSLNDCDMIFNCEPSMWPAEREWLEGGNPGPPPPIVTNRNIESEIAAKEGHQPSFLNSGVWMARTSYAVEVLEKCQAMPYFEYKFIHDLKNQTQDQIFFRKAHWDCYPRVKLDYKCKLCQVLQRKEWDATVNKGVSIWEIKEEINYGIGISGA